MQFCKKTSIGIPLPHRTSPIACSMDKNYLIVLNTAKRTWSPVVRVLRTPHDPPPLLHPQPCGSALQVFASLRFKSFHLIKKKRNHRYPVISLFLLLQGRLELPQARCSLAPQSIYLFILDIFAMYNTQYWRILAPNFIYII